MRSPVVVIVAVPSANSPTHATFGDQSDGGRLSRPRSSSSAGVRGAPRVRRHPQRRRRQAPDAGPDRQYALHPALAYTHIALALPYLILAPLQLTRSFRERHFSARRRIGRTVVPLTPQSAGAALLTLAGTDPADLTAAYRPPQPV